MKRDDHATGTIRTPIGALVVVRDASGARTVRFDTAGSKRASPRSVASKEAREVREYFAGKRKHFTAALDTRGTPFQRAVWRAVAKIPYGATATYGEIARDIGHPRAVRAVGTAVGANPCCILIPCHRVVPSSGGIGKYAYGARRKAWLLKHEKSAG